MCYILSKTILPLITKQICLIFIFYTDYHYKNKNQNKKSHIYRSLDADFKTEEKEKTN